MKKAIVYETIEVNKYFDVDNNEIKNISPEQKLLISIYGFGRVEREIKEEVKFSFQYKTLREMQATYYNTCADLGLNSLNHHIK